MTNVQPRPANAYRGTAICDECGTTRQYKRPRNHVTHDVFAGPRETGELKCANCGLITTHALIIGSDWFEEYDAAARGRDPYPGTNAEQQHALQDPYRRSQEENPRLRHSYFVADADAAIERGDYRVRAFCGRMITGPTVRNEKTTVKLPLSDTIPARVAHDDLSTFLTSWVEADCVDCSYAWNRMVLERQRKKLTLLMTTALAELLNSSQARQYDTHVGDLISLLQRVHGEGGDQQ